MRNVRTHTSSHVHPAPMVNLMFLTLFGLDLKPRNGYKCIRLLVDIRYLYYVNHTKSIASNCSNNTKVWFIRSTIINLLYMRSQREIDTDTEDKTMCVI